MKKETITEYLECVSKANSSTDKDSRIMNNLLHTLQFSSAKVVLGIVYLEGHGTLEAPPQSIHTIAGYLLKAFKKQESVQHDK